MEYNVLLIKHAFILRATLGLLFNLFLNVNLVRVLIVNNT